MMERGKKRPYYIRLPGGATCGMAGISDIWSQRGYEPIRSCAIITTEAAPSLSHIQERMSVILSPEEEALWLNPRTRQRDLAALLRPYTGEMEFYPLDKRSAGKAEVTEAIQVGSLLAE